MLPQSTSRMRLVLRSRVRIYAGLTLIIVACLFSLVQYHHPTKELVTNRDLQETDSKCTHLAPWEHSYGILVYSALLLYIFISLAIVADDYFVASLERISSALQLSNDVAGATFMAAGSSAPELFVALADNVFQKPVASLGIGTIVGSSIFNLLIIIALSTLLAGHVLVLDWRPFLRDSLWYLWAILLLTYSIWDGQVNVIESMGLVLSYVSYCVFMSQNERVIGWCCARPEREEKGIAEATDVERESSSTTTTIGTVEEGHPHRLKAKSTSSSINPMHQSKYRMFQYQHERSSAEDPDEDPTQNQSSTQTQNQPLSPHSEPLRPYFAEVFDIPSCRNPLAVGWFLLTRPIVLILRCTIPDCHYALFTSPRGYLCTFLISIGWIGILSHLTIEFASRIGCIAGIPPALMGLTIIAAGTSVPDALSSILVARAGHGDMAVSNVIGSNVFDILLGLGLPFLLSNLVYHQTVVVMIEDLSVSLLVLFGVLVAVVLLLILSKWRLHPILGMVMIVLYIGYIFLSYIRGLQNE